MNEELKNFMNELWGAEGKLVDTPLGQGKIEEVRTMGGVDFSVRVKIPDTDGSTLFSGLKLFKFKSQ